MIGLYIHIPFCASKCYYCDFTSYIKNEYLINDYIDALLLELDLYKHEKFDTIFIGGGTPSYLNDKQLEILLKGISSICDLTKVLEFTIECNPGTLTYNKLNIMKYYGVNRLSIGLQSANSSTLNFIGRTHSFDDFEKSINYAQNIGFKNINADIIYGIPNENLDVYKVTLQKLVEYDLSHISAYNLILENNTKFYNMYKKGEFTELDENIQIDMYNYTKYFLESNGFEHYEISNYCRNNKPCLHNLIYWNFDDYIGIGVSSHSFYKNKRIENIKDLNKYIRALKQDNKIIYKNIHDNSFIDNIEEYIMVGLRKIRGISIEDFYSRFNIDFVSRFEKVIEKYKKNGLINVKDGRIFITNDGLMLMNLILKDFIQNKL
ncbi:radical SAM family heme chaperone HemW [Candidatus Arthromitus sp. SFB-rat-Yit]|uniref:radical SAM family heme chaperone HemW n=1 Tax=Candidatus Arthromitus sp. SFB-rat-Yit TaxID=1041504 RepID=UPI000227A190|nr:radical SAM family heme chaperone HemW [Candidatus Arthromitus sp. SFB-rat-Yit]BAK81360.1 oxygen-independent coproporphyrinogen III oxidase [Candidatus Arthromitus sp. SFB-rat-Yit]